MRYSSGAGSPGGPHFDGHGSPRLQAAEEARGSVSWPACRVLHLFKSLLVQAREHDPGDVMFVNWQSLADSLNEKFAGQSRENRVSAMVCVILDFVMG